MWGYLLDAALRCIEPLEEQKFDRPDSLPGLVSSRFSFPGYLSELSARMAQLQIFVLI